MQSADEVTSVVDLYKRGQRAFCAVFRNREARRALRVQTLERSVRGDLEKAVQKMFRANCL